LGRKIGCRSTVQSSPWLRIVDQSQDLPALDPVSFMDANLDDVPHHLCSQLARLGRAQRAHGLDDVRDVRSLCGNHRNVAHDFGRRTDRLAFARAADEYHESQQKQHQDCGRYEFRHAVQSSSRVQIHGMTTGDCRFKVPLANSRLA
jgi:hypothetical protein